MPPILSAFTAREEPIEFTAGICLLLAAILGIISRPEYPSKIVLTGMLIAALIFASFLGVRLWRQAEMRALNEKREAATRERWKKQEAEAKARYEAAHPQKTDQNQ